MRSMETTYEYSYSAKPSPAYQNRRLAERYRSGCQQDHLQAMPNQGCDDHFKTLYCHPSACPNRKQGATAPTMPMQNNCVQAELLTPPCPLANSCNTQYNPSYFYQHHQTAQAQRPNEQKYLSDVSPIPGVFTNSPGLTVPEARYELPTAISSYLPMHGPNATGMCYASTYWGPYVSSQRM